MALDLSKVSELVVAPSAAGLIPNSTTAEPREAGCFCIALTAVGTLQDDTHRGDRGPGDKDGLLAEAMVERAMALSGEAAERDLREDPSEFTSFIHKLQTGSFFRSSGGSDRQRRQSLLDGSPDLCSGLEVLSAYVPKFVWQRCLDHAGFETIAENRRVAILFIVSGFQVTANSGITLAAARHPILRLLFDISAAAVAAELQLGPDGSAGPSSRHGEGDRCGGGRVQRHHPPGDELMTASAAAAVTGLRRLLRSCSSASLTSVHAGVIASDHYGREGTGRHLCLRSARLQAQQPASSVRESCSFSHRAARGFWGPVLSRGGRGGLLLRTGWRPTAAL